MALSAKLADVSFKQLEKSRGLPVSVVPASANEAIFDLPQVEGKDRHVLHPARERISDLEASIYSELKSLPSSNFKSELGKLLHMGARNDALELVLERIDHIRADPLLIWDDGAFSERARLNNIAEGLLEWSHHDQNVPREIKPLVSSVKRKDVEPLLAIATEIVNSIYKKKDKSAEISLEPSSARAIFGSPTWGTREIGFRLDPCHDGDNHGPGGDRLHLDLQCLDKKFRVFHCADGSIGVYNIEKQSVASIDVSNRRSEKLRIIIGNDGALTFLGGKGVVEKSSAKEFVG